MKMNKRIFKIISLALIQAFLVMDWGWADSFEFIGKLECEQNATLSPHIYIQENSFQKAYDVFCNTVAGEKGQKKYPQMDEKMELKKKLLQWKKYGLSEFYSVVENENMDAIKIAGIKLNFELCYGVGLYSIIFGLILIAWPNLAAFFAIAGTGLILAGLGGRLLMLLMMKYYKYSAGRLLFLAYKEMERNGNF